MLTRTTLAVLIAGLLSVSAPQAAAGDFGVWFSYGEPVSRCYDYSYTAVAPVPGYAYEAWDYEVPTYVGCWPGPVVIYGEPYPVYRTTYTRSACFEVPHRRSHVSIHLRHHGHHHHSHHHRSHHHRRHHHHRHHHHHHHHRHHH